MTRLLFSVNIPPSGLGKVPYYIRKYGVLHGLCSLIGRYNHFFWRLVGPAVTAKYLQNWLKSDGYKVLNLGGGSNCINGCLTADIDPRADVYADMTKPLNITDNSVNAVFCEEAIEHITREQGIAIVKECCRIIKPGGMIRISTPDLDYYAEKSKTEGASGSLNEVFYGHGHVFIYSRACLREIATSAGFVNIKVSSYRDEKSALGGLDSHAERFRHDPEISQYMEAEKPI